MARAGRRADHGRAGRPGPRARRAPRARGEGPLRPRRAHGARPRRPRRRSEPGHPRDRGGGRRGPRRHGRRRRPGHPAARRRGGRGALRRDPRRRPRRRRDRRRPSPREGARGPRGRAAPEGARRSRARRGASRPDARRPRLLLVHERGARPRRPGGLRRRERVPERLRPPPGRGGVARARGAVGGLARRGDGRGGAAALPRAARVPAGRASPPPATPRERRRDRLSRRPRREAAVGPRRAPPPRRRPRPARDRVRRDGAGRPGGLRSLPPATRSRSPTWRSRPRWSSPRANRASSRRSLRPAEDGSVAISIRSVPAAGRPSSTRRAACARSPAGRRARSTSPPRGPLHAPPAELRPRRAEPAAGAGAGLRPPMEGGPPHGLRRRRRRSAHLELPEALAGDLETYGLHPGLLDMATGFAFSLVEGGATLHAPLVVRPPARGDAPAPPHRQPRAPSPRVRPGSRRPRRDARGRAGPGGGRDRGLRGEGGRARRARPPRGAAPGRRRSNAGSSTASPPTRASTSSVACSPRTDEVQVLVSPLDLHAMLAELRPKPPAASPAPPAPPATASPEGAATAAPRRDRGEARGDVARPARRRAGGPPRRLLRPRRPLARRGAALRARQEDVGCGPAARHAVRGAHARGPGREGAGAPRPDPRRVEPGAVGRHRRPRRPAGRPSS